MASSVLLSYRFDSSAPASREGSYPLTGVSGEITAGPGRTALGDLSRAMRFAGRAYLAADLGPGSIPARYFTVRLLAQPAAGTGTELLCRAGTVPFWLWLTPGATPEERGLLGLVDAQAHGQQGIQILRGAPPLRAGRWYLLDLVYCHDTLGVFVDGALVHAFGLPDGRLRTAPSGRLEVGGDAADAGTRFQGTLAALQVYAGAPLAHERSLEAARGSAMWHITWKHTLLDGRARIGRAVGGLERDRDTNASVLRFERGLILHEPRLGAFLLDGELHRGYLALPPAERRALGTLTSDPVELERPACRFARFSGGGLFASAHTGVVAVTGRIYRRWLEQGGPGGYAGLPRNNAWRFRGGREQLFQHARYYEDAAAEQAFEVRGGILAKFLALGGVGGCGMPRSDEQAVHRGGRTIGARSDFERCAIFHRDPRDTFSVPLDYLRAFQESGGIEGELGLPTSDVGHVALGGRSAEYQTYERGILVRLPGVQKPFVCVPFDLFLKRLVTEESEGIGMGQNDPYFFLTLYRSSFGQDEQPVYQRRYPASGDYGGNIVELDATLPEPFPVDDPALVYRLRADVWESDSFTGFDDDHLGDVGYELSIFNAWGQAEASGVIEATAGKATLLFSVKPRFHPENYDPVAWRFFPFQNLGTEVITWQEYATAFAGDVDTDTSIDDVILDPLGTIWAAIFYPLVRFSARGGNCWGFAVEAHQAWDGTSVFSPPLRRYTWAQAEDEINVKFATQLGSDRLAYWLGEFVVGQTQNPVHLFEKTREEAVYGRLPLISLWEKATGAFGKRHVILPYAWNDASTPWTIEAYDSNHPSGPTFLTVFPEENRFHYQPGETLYEGRRGAGSRLFYTPWWVAGNIPAPLPFLDFLIDLVLAFGFAVLWDLVESLIFADAEGRNLDLLAAPPADSRRRPFMLVPVLPADDDGPARLMLRKAYTGSANFVHEIKVSGAAGPHKPWRYALAFGSGELFLTGTGLAGARLRLSFGGVGRSDSHCAVAASAAGTFTLVSTSRIDEERGQVKLVVEGLAVGPDRPVRFSAKPSVEGLELLVAQPQEVEVTLTYHRRGEQSTRRYRLPLAAGARLRPSDALATGELLVHEIRALNGVSWGTSVLAPEA